MVREYGFAAFGARSARRALGNASGWGECVTLLKFFIEHGVTYDERPKPSGDAGRTLA
jgi:hypothetical protein